MREVNLGHQDHLDNLAPEENLVLLDLQDLQDQLVLEGNQGLGESLVHGVRPGHQVLQDSLEVEERRGLQVQSDQQDHLVQQDLVVRQDLLGCPA